MAILMEALSPPPFDEADLFDIADQIRNRLCVPFLGAAVNENLPCGKDVAGRLAQEIRPLLPCDEESLPQVAWQYELRRNRARLYAALKRHLPDDDHQPSLLLRTLAELDAFKLIITTNFDRLLERALNDAGKVVGQHYQVIVQPENGWDLADPMTKKQLDQWSIFKGLWVYKIHGTFEGRASNAALSTESSEEEPAVTNEPIPPMTVTEEDYISFMTATGNFQEGRIGLPDFIQTRIKISTLLFLGYGLQDWNIRAIYNGVIGKMDKKNRNPAYAVQLHPVNLWREFWVRQGVNVRSCDVQEFARMLKAVYQQKFR